MDVGESGKQQLASASNPNVAETSSAASSGNRARYSRAGIVALVPAVPLACYGSPEGPRSSSPGGSRPAGTPKPLGHSISPTSCPTANPSERNEASGNPLSWSRACPTLTGVDLIPSRFGWRRIGVLKPSLAEKRHHSYLASWERELRPRLPVYKQSWEESSLTSFRI